MRALLLKRLESSIEAFRSTLNTLIGSNRNFREALEAGFVPVGSTATRILAGSQFDADELLEVLEQEEERRRRQRQGRAGLVHSTDDFDLSSWLADLDDDHETLSEIRDRISDIGPDDDDKLHTLRRFLDLPAVRRGKVLIFSESETTIDYLYGELNPGGGDQNIAKLTGSNSDSAVSIIRRFSPRSNSVENGRRRNDIRVLLATDVVSEGQNLQDCARVLNYDLHWNPVRLIQRFGRVDRIGTEHARIYLHNMWPDLAVDAGISLVERLGNRIQMFHDIIGLDSELLSESERVNNTAMYRIYESRELPDEDDVLDEVAASQHAQSLLQTIQAKDPDLWETITGLPDGIRSALMVQLPSADQENERYTQAPLLTHGAQLPMSLRKRLLNSLHSTLLARVRRSCFWRPVG